MMHHAIARFSRFLYRPITLYVAAWILTLGIAAARWCNARQVFDYTARIDGNSGHTTIDFGAQWLMGRMLTSGHGKELCQIDVLRKVARTAFTGEYNNGDEGLGDADRLMSLYMRVEGEEEIGGMLYPPIQAFMMAPFALGDHPQRSYFVLQWFMLGYCFVGGLGIRFLSRGRIWWPVGTSLILLFPGCKGGLDLAQNSSMTLMILICGWAVVVRGYPFLGGLIWGLLAYKPVWAISFMLALLMLRQWRACLAMIFMGVLMIQATIPFVGIDSWIHWFKIGQEAAIEYTSDANWIHLSRDLLSTPRRLFVDFENPESQRTNVWARSLSVGLWMLVFELTMRTFFLVRGKKVPLTGPLPAFVFFAAWMCTYHYMYYDSLIALFAIIVLLADPRPYFQQKQVEVVPDEIAFGPQARRSSIYLNSLVLSVLTIILLHENTLRLADIEATVIARNTFIHRSIESSIHPPQIYLGSGDKYAWELALILVLWLWCGGMVLMGIGVSEKPLDYK